MRNVARVVLGALGILIVAVGPAACRSNKSSVPQSGDAAATGGGPAPGAEISPAARSEADEIFATRCTPCHGPTGAGDGPASKGLSPPPRNFHDGGWQGSVSDAAIEQIIRYGGGAVGKSPGMPANPDLAEKPDVVAALREHIRQLGR